MRGIVRSKLILISIAAVVCVSTCPAYASAKLTPSEVASKLLLSQAATMTGTGEVTFEMALGTDLEATNMMEGIPRTTPLNENGVYKCFTPCTPTDIEGEQRMERELQQEAYLVVMRGRTFAPLEKLRRGTSEGTGNFMTVVIDARTGFQKRLAIGGESPPPQPSALGPVTLLLVPGGTTAQAASRKVCYAHRVGHRLRCNR